MIEAAVISPLWSSTGSISSSSSCCCVRTPWSDSWEEHQAGNAIAALRSKLAVKARVLRDGKWGDPNASELVPGDVIRMRLGDIVPADAHLLPGDPIEVDESALTGESLPATRKPGDAVFSGSIVRRGETNAMVYATGSHTYFGKTAQLVQGGPNR